MEGVIDEESQIINDVPDFDEQAEQEEVPTDE